MSDGELVTVALSKGTLTSANFVSTPSGIGEQLQLINLSAGGYDGANLTLTVKKVVSGDGLANVGFIDSTGHDLGRITVPGDLGRINAGDANTATPGIKSLTVSSMGSLDLTTQSGAASLESDITGSLGALTVKGRVSSMPSSTSPARVTPASAM